MTVALLLLVISAAAVIAVLDWRHRHEIAYAHPHDNVQWLVFQGGYETMRFRNALHGSLDMQTNDDLLLRHEIFQSRIITLTTSAIGNLLRSDDEATAAIKLIDAQAASLDDAIASGMLESMRARQVLAVMLEDLIVTFNTLGMRAIHVSAQLRTDDLNELRRSHGMAVQLVSIAAGCVLGLFVIVAFQIRRLGVERVRAEQASSAKSTFLATMSHELRTPLSGVIGTLDLLAEDPLPETARQRVLTARNSADHLLGIIGNVLDMAKLEAGRTVLDAVPFDIGAVLDSTVATFAASASVKGISLRGSVAPAAAGWYAGDALRIGEVLCNLVSNALKFTEAGEVVITIGAKAAHDPAGKVWLEIAVRDTGIGIAPEALPRLGGVFQQADGSTARRYGGSGLGLAISRALAAAMGGGLAIASTPGVGTTVTATLLLHRAAEPLRVDTAEPEAPRAHGVAGALVLLADDNPVGQDIARTMLERLGARVDVAADGVEAVAKASTSAYDLILMDMQMPNLDGLDATRAIRAGTGPSARTRIVALTANAFTDDTERCIAAGMDAHLTKPVRKAMLVKELQSLATRHASIAAPQHVASKAA